MCQCGENGLKIDNNKLCVFDDGCEEWYPIENAKFCPFCGIALQPERLSEKTSKEDAIV